MKPIPENPLEWLRAILFIAKFYILAAFFCSGDLQHIPEQYLVDVIYFCAGASLLLFIGGLIQRCTSDKPKAVWNFVMSFFGLMAISLMLPAFAK